MAVTTTIISSRPSAAILIISSRSMRGPCVLLTQDPRIDHLSSDAELKIGSHVAEPAHTDNTVPPSSLLAVPAGRLRRSRIAPTSAGDSQAKSFYTHGIFLQH